jgi:antitoxin VapB
MSLNIKDSETHRLVKELAREAGESLKTAVTIAVRERLERLRARRRRKKDALYAELIALGKRGAALAPGPHIDHAELLYDENGLPK